jgi:hypothetical protein
MKNTNKVLQLTISLGYLNRNKYDQYSESIFKHWNSTKI